MGTGVLVVRAVGLDDADALYATPSQDLNGLILEREDGPNVWTFPAESVEVSQWQGNKWRDVEFVRDVHATCYITDSRFVVMCSKYDKGGGWIGGLGALALNAGSMALAARRRSGKCLTAQLRYAWISKVGGSRKLGMLDAEMLAVRFLVSGDGHTVPLQMSLILPKNADSHVFAAEIVRRAAAYRLAAGEHLLEAQDEPRLRALASARPLTNAKGQFAMHELPGAWPIGRSSATLYEHIRRQLPSAREGSPTAEQDPAATVPPVPEAAPVAPVPQAAPVPSEPLAPRVDVAPPGASVQAATSGEPAPDGAVPFAAEPVAAPADPQGSPAPAGRDPVQAPPDAPEPDRRARFCPECGRPGDGNYFCTGCGHSLT